MKIFNIGDYADFVFESNEIVTAIQIKIFNIVEPKPAYVLSNLEPFADLENTSITLSVSGGSEETVVFDKNYQTASDVANFINSEIYPNFDFTAVEDKGRIKIQSLLEGSQSNLIISSNTSLGFSEGIYFGEDLSKNDYLGGIEFSSIFSGLYAVSLYLDSEFFVPNETYFLLVELENYKIIKEFKVVKKQTFASVNFVS
jgi:hypothetical protein